MAKQSVQLEFNDKMEAELEENLVKLTSRVEKIGQGEWS